MKILDRERVEPPHVTLIRGLQRWRFCLRTERFLDREPDPDDVPAELVEAIHSSIGQLREEWDARYPENPVTSTEKSDD